MPTHANREPASDRLLLVDDDPLLLGLLKLFLAAGGFELHTASSGAEALSLAMSLQPALILLDVQMPDMDGFETCRRLKAEPATAAIPVIFITAASGTADIEEAFAVGGSDYVRKPLEPHELKVRVDNQILLHEARQRATQHLLETEKLAQLGQLVGAMTHEIATPIGNSKLSIDLLRQSIRQLDLGYQEKRLTQSQLKQFLEQGTEAVEIAANALEFAAQLLQSFKVVAVDQCAEREYRIRVSEYIQRVLLSLRPKLKRTRIQVQVDGLDYLEITTEPGAIAQILTNLVTNSLVHGFAEGASGTIRITYAQLDGEFELHYRDDGAGIAPEHLAHIFEAYFTTKAGRGGSGLGMNIVHTLVTQRLHGRIECSSVLGQGVHFVIRFPLAVASAAAPG